jgi:tetratricopeptide (TPR) repeat protein/TolB-like protein
MCDCSGNSNRRVPQLLELAIGPPALILPEPLIISIDVQRLILLSTFGLSLFLAAEHPAFSQDSHNKPNTSFSSAPQPDQTVSTANPAQAEHNGHLLLVLPFDNRTSQANLDWLGEAAPEILNRRLTSAGFLPISRADRLYALDHLGLPLNFRPSRASTLRLAQMLDTDFIVLGSYSVVNGRFAVSAQIVDVKGLKLSTPITDQADLVRVMDVLNSLAWRVVKQLDPKYLVAEQTFIAAGSNVRLDAFEKYVRGVTETNPGIRIRELRDAVHLSPDMTPAWLALGKAYFENEQYDLAATTLAKVSTSDRLGTEAGFYRGLAYFNTGRYVQAEESFAAVAKLLPLPEVVNNQGVAASRHGRDGAPQFQQALASDPNDPDYHFNLAIALQRKGQLAEASREIAQCLKLRPSDAEAQSLADRLRSDGTKFTLSSGIAEDQPLERIKRSYNEASFRQAAFELEQMQQLQLQTLPAAARASSLTQQGTQYLNRGLVLEAEREFQTALAADASNALAHAGLAQVREHSGETEAARKEAQQSLSLAPNVPAYLVLARLDLAVNQLQEAAADVGNALKVDANSPAARGMRQALAARGQQVP